MEKSGFDNQSPSTDELIRWLHAVELTTPRRFAGLLTELYFSRYIRQSGRYSDVAQGWSYISDDIDSGKRFWFKILHDLPQLSPAEQQFASCLASLGHSFFLLSANVTVVGEQRLPNIEFQAAELSVIGTGWNTTKTKRAEKLEARINELLTPYLACTVHSRLKASSEGPLSFKRWIENLEAIELQTLFLQRCFMNCRAPSPVDLDAVAITHDGQIAFVEFKRKYPTNGASKPKHGPMPFEDLMTSAREVASELRPKEPADMKSATKLFKSASEARGFKYVSDRSFGLDTAHFETLKLCFENGISYDYFVWNSESEPHRGAFKLSKIIADLESVLSDDLVEARAISWWVRSLQPADARGLTFTWGDKSGSYDSGFRVQFTFDEK